ncbi:sulfite exporter TauE/SafE family protein [Limibacillus sp. MBR-115]|uniref:sulfite exporter TauE/SafE family protein n=1 Tax=Limibacillus sp. MBR-115 TaxID=3156465 RepID=UPI00339B5621
MDALPEMTFLALFVLAMTGTGLLGGVLAGMLGVGGGIVIVPVLFHLLGLLGVAEGQRMHVAVATSLATIVATSVSSARAHSRRGSVDWTLLKSLLVSVLIGVAVGTAFATYVKGPVLSAIFGAVALIVAANMALRREGFSLVAEVPKGLLRQVFGFIIGGFSSMMGIGGGTLAVPLLSLCSYPIRNAVGTSSALGLVIAVPATAGFIYGGWQGIDLPPFSLGYVNVLGFLLIAPATVLTAPWGARIAHSINVNYLRKAFALFLIITGIRMIVSLF